MLDLMTQDEESEEVLKTCLPPELPGKLQELHDLLAG
eukprot:CAMPEP_0171091566 /NCGR_PEP_ID=MMETSP0766_2-20121228/34105_1 /TAXON_ID=439317 /ORGANISM="Gambierdiscus australes, Strain CAWD 149" /LENGTH=36 /DNA_ID= /DNA_START= /DNA_END= /DNA_ORIENTATION=